MKYTFDWEVYGKLARQAVAEGCVLLKNQQDTLPIKQDDKVSVFGRIQLDYYKSGTGSGGLVNAPYVIGILEGLRNEKVNINESLVTHYEEWIKEHPFDLGQGWAQEPWSQEEMPLEPKVVEEAAAHSDMALIIIGRTAGEDRDNSLTPGSYLLTEQEKSLIEMVCNAFERVAVILNVGNIIDMSWVDDYKPGAVLYGWQGGCQGGNGVADVLTGKTNPSGRLSNTIPYKLEDYPSAACFGDEKANAYIEDVYVGYRYFETFAKEQVMYPFGFGLSYTEFEMELLSFTPGNEVTIEVEVTNKGNRSGKEVVQVYYCPPQGVLGKPLRNLIEFGKTKELLPGECEKLQFKVLMKDLVSYDDGGYSGHKYSYILEAGDYEFYVGKDVRRAQLVGGVPIKELQVIEQLSQACAPTVPFKRMKANRDQNGVMSIIYEDAPLRQECHLIEQEELNTCGYTGDQGYKLMDVFEERIDLPTFMSQLSDKDLICMSRGEGMCSPKVTPGTAGSFGGVTKGLQDFGIPVACCADGPSGIRMDNGTIAFSLPNGTSLSCTFNTSLCSELFEMEALELRKNNIDTLLGPGINIHRNPLNGRNFEYFSEDPVITGHMAIAQLRSLHKYQVTGTIKHFVCNNQEYKRTEVDAIVSERALREIYLKGFELAVKKGLAYSIMTTYGPLNGIYTAGNYDLLTTILRKEWGFNGIVMTDWWAKINDEGKEASQQNTARMIKAQNDLYMVVNDAENNSHNDNAEKGLKEGVYHRGDLARNGMNICEFLLKSPALLRLNDKENIQWLEYHSPANKASDTVILEDVTPDKEGVFVEHHKINTQRGASAKFNVKATGMSKFAIDLSLSAQIKGVAQVPMTVYLNNQVLETITLNAQNCKEYTSAVEYSTYLSLNSYIKLYFGESGIKIDYIRVRKI